MWSFNTIVLATLLCASAVHCFPEGRVVNGTDSEITKWPFIVSLRGASGGHSCGASIIAPQWVLTAAHCVASASPASISLQFASTTASASSTNVAYVQRIIIHESYNPNDVYIHDIALLKLLGQMIFNGKTIAPITLPEQGYEIPQTPEGVQGNLVGWGRNETGGPVQTILQEVDLKIYSDAECNERHGGIIKSSQICGGVDEGGKGQCNGDSGGPLIYNGMQLGIVSWSIKPCTVYPYPGVYTKVSHYVNWIKLNMV